METSSTQCGITDTSIEAESIAEEQMPSLFWRMVFVQQVEQEVVATIFKDNAFFAASSSPLLG